MDVFVINTISNRKRRKNKEEQMKTKEETKMNEYKLDARKFGAIISNIYEREYHVRKVEGAKDTLEVQHMFNADRSNGRIVLGLDNLLIQIEDDGKGYSDKLFDVVKQYLVLE